MPEIDTNNADKIIIGSSEADKLYRGSNIVWMPPSNGGGGSSFDPMTLFSGSNSGRVGCWYDLGDRASLFIDTSRTTPITASGQFVRGVEDKSGNNLHLASTDVNSEFVYSEVSEASFVSSDENTNSSYRLQSTSNAFLSNGAGLSFFMSLKTSDTRFILLTTESSGKFLGVANSGSGAGPSSGFTGSFSYHVDGGSPVFPVNRDTIYNAFSTNSKVVAEIQNFNFPSSTRLAIFGYPAASGFSLSGDIYEVICAQNVTAQERLDIVSYLQSKP